MNENHQDPSALPAVGRWSRPGFIQGLFGKKPETFKIARSAIDNREIDLNTGSANLKWENGHWHNSNFTEQPPNLHPSKAEIHRLQKENSEMQVQCEILLHMLTVSEMSKVRAQNRLNELKEQITQKLRQIESQSE